MLIVENGALLGCQVSHRGYSKNKNINATVWHTSRLVVASCQKSRMLFWIGKAERYICSLFFSPAVIPKVIRGLRMPDKLKGKEMVR
jgi:hypothetical protein